MEDVCPLELGPIFRLRHRIWPIRGIHTEFLFQRLSFACLPTSQQCTFSLYLLLALLLSPVLLLPRNPSLLYKSVGDADFCKGNPLTLTFSLRRQTSSPWRRMHEAVSWWVRKDPMVFVNLLLTGIIIVILYRCITRGPCMILGPSLTAAWIVMNLSSSLLVLAKSFKDGTKGWKSKAD